MPFSMVAPGDFCHFDSDCYLIGVSSAMQWEKWRGHNAHSAVPPQTHFCVPRRMAACTAHRPMSNGVMTAVLGISC